MPRARGFRDPRTVSLIQQKPSQLRQLLRSDAQRITTSRLPQSSLELALHRIRGAHNRHRNPRATRDKYLLKSANHGYTAAIKDNFVTRDLPTTCASNILDGFAAEDATAVRLMREAGMELLAKTNMDEFGMGSHSTHSAYGAVTNDAGKAALSAGGSSGGSALAVASRFVDMAIGSDTGGSVRLPAAYTRTVGFKPSYGTISRYGLIPYANSLDTVGLIGRTCHDVHLLYGILAQYDSKDPTCLTPETRLRISESRKARRQSGELFTADLHPPAPDRERVEREVRKRHWDLFGNSTYRRRVGVPIEYNIKEMHPLVRKSWIRTLSSLQSHGHEIVPISLPSTQQALSAYYVLAPAEASSNLAKYDGVRYGKLRDVDFKDDEGGTLYSKYRGAFFGEEVKRRILLGSFTLSAGSMDNYFIQAQKVRRIVQSDFNAVFKMPHPLLPNSVVNPQGIDYIICPTAPTPPPTLAEVRNSNLLDSYINDVFTVPASLAGLPAVSVPAHLGPRPPVGYHASIGIQVIGQFGDDLGVLGFAAEHVECLPDYDRPMSIRDRQARFK